MYHDHADGRFHTHGASDNHLHEHEHADGIVHTHAHGHGDHDHDHEHAPAAVQRFSPARVGTVIVEQFARLLRRL